jgi:hypothetical protein
VAFDVCMYVVYVSTLPLTREADCQGKEGVETSLVSNNLLAGGFKQDQIIRCSSFFRWKTTRRNKQAKYSTLTSPTLFTTQVVAGLKGPTYITLTILYTKNKQTNEKSCNMPPYRCDLGVVFLLCSGSSVS